MRWCATVSAGRCVPATSGQATAAGHTLSIAVPRLRAAHCASLSRQLAAAEHVARGLPRVEDKDASVRDPNAMMLRVHCTLRMLYSLVGRSCTPIGTVSHL